ncbi:Fc.00g048790.m01.CDS01 [Cosmosporella sp. VM-42]
MAEVIGIASGVAGLVTFAAQITKLSYNLISDLKEASQTQRLYLQEVSGLTDVLFRADSALANAEALGLPGLRPTSLSESLITDCSDQLSRIRDDLAAGIKRAKWLFQEKELRKRITSLHSFHNIFFDYLSTHTLTIATETHREVSGIRRRDQCEKLLRWMEPSIETSKPAPTPTPGTGRRFLYSERYRDWRDGDTTTLWCQGPPGSGKSVLASIIVQDLVRRELGQSLVAYYFCDYAIRQQQDSISILQSLLRRLLDQVEATIISPIVKLQEDAKGEPTTKVLSEMIVTICKLVPSTYLILDAPDELDDPKEIVALFNRFSAAGCKVLISSRDTPDLRHALSTANTTRFEAMAEDVLLFLEHRFREEGHHHLLSRGQDLLEKVVERANGIFLLAKILVDKLLDMTTLAQMRKSMVKMPTTITEAFESSVKRIDAQSLARRELAYRVIAWITQSQRRLKVNELVHALAVEEDSDEFDEDNIPDVKLILRVCVGLVTKEATDDSVGMVHTTAHEFFHARSPANARKDIASACLTYLTVTPFTLGPCKSLDEITERINQRPFMLYAAKFWGKYIDTEEVEEELSFLINKLLCSHELRLSSFQALHYYSEITERVLATESLATIPTGQDAIHLAAYWNLAHTTESLLRNGHDRSARDSQQWTPLHWACSRESLASIRHLITAGADLNARDSQGWTPLFWLAMKGNEAGMRMMLSSNANYLARDLHGWTALTWATSTHKRSVVKMLLEHHEACLSDLEKVPAQFVRQLTFEEAREHPSRRQGHSAAEVAADSGDTDLFDILCLGKQVKFEDLWSQGHFNVPVSNVWRTLNKGESINGVESYISNTIQGPGESGLGVWRGRLLHGAIKDDKYMAARALVELGADVNCRLTRMPLHAAAFRNDPRYAKLLLEYGADPSMRDWYGQTALHQAVVNGFISTTLELLRGSSDVNARVLERNPRLRRQGGHVLESKTPLILACGLSQSRWGRESPDSETVPSAMISLLLSHGADVNLTDTNGMSALHHAAKAGHHEVVQKLIKAGADVHAEDHTQRTPLHYGVASADMKLIEVIVDSGANINAVDGQGKHMIHCLAYERWFTSPSSDGLQNILSILTPTSNATALNVEWTRVVKAEWNAIKDSKQETDTPLSLALRSEKWELFELLHQLGATLPPSFDVQPYFPRAVKLSQQQAVQTLLKLGATTGNNVFSLETLDLSHSRVGYGFHWGQAPESLSSFATLLKTLLEAGLDINQVQEKGVTALLLAAGGVDSSDLMQLLLDSGANPRQKTDGGLDAFMVSALQGNCQSLRTLLDWAVKTPLKDHWTESVEAHPPDDSLPWMVRALEHHYLLEERKQTGYYRNVKTCTLLWLSVELGNEAMVKELLKHGADLETMDDCGWRPLHVAAYGGFIEIVRALLLQGADVGVLTHKWPCYYSWNRPSGRTAMSAHYDGSDGWQGNALHLAAMKGFPDIVELLISHGADVTTHVQGEFQCPGEGPTALHLALATGTFYGRRADPLCKERLRIAEVLIANGADVNTTADHIFLEDVLKFEQYRHLWDQLRKGITDNGARVPKKLRW